MPGADCAATSGGVTILLDDIRRGLAASFPVTVAVSPIGALFGAVAVGNGLTVADAALMSATAYAGASQFVAVDLFGREVPAWSILLSVFAVNVRHVLYSAAIAPLVRHLRPRTKAGVFFFLADPAFGFTETEAQEGRRFSATSFFAYSALMYGVWIAATIVGGAFGRLIEHPERWAIDMLFPIYFLALVMSFRARAFFWRTATVSAVVAAVVYHGAALGLPIGPPWHVALGGLAGILAAAFSVPREPPEAVLNAAEAADLTPEPRR